MSALIFILVTATAAIIIPLRLSDGNKNSTFYLGVSFCGNTEAEAKLLIDRIKTYSNLFVLQSFAISRNQTALLTVCDYAVNSGMSVIINMLAASNRTEWTSWQFQTLQNATQRWGDKFLGAYHNDDLGGLQLDYDWQTFFNDMQSALEDPETQMKTSQYLSMYNMYLKIQDYRVNGTKPTDYALEKQVFLDFFQLNNTVFNDLKSSNIKLYISDYVLYWYDFLAGYDTVFTQLGHNISSTQNIDLIRGAAQLQNKQWGAIITWKYDHPPYLDTGDETYRQMLMAYQAGASYVILFDYPYTEGGNPYGVLQDEHFYTMEKFSHDVMATSKMRTLSDQSKAQAVLVLPRDYAFGMRYKDDTIWGYWPSDEKAPQVWNISRVLLGQYGLGLDIVYDDPQFPLAGKYSQVYFWNQTIH